MDSAVPSDVNVEGSRHLGNSGNRRTRAHFVMASAGADGDNRRSGRLEGPEGSPLSVTKSTRSEPPIGAAWRADPGRRGPVPDRIFGRVIASWPGTNLWRPICPVRALGVAGFVVSGLTRTHHVFLRRPRRCWSRRAFTIAGDQGQGCRPIDLLAALAEVDGPIGELLRSPDGRPLFPEAAAKPGVRGRDQRLSRRAGDERGPEGLHKSVGNH